MQYSPKPRLHLRVPDDYASILKNTGCRMLKNIVRPCGLFQMTMYMLGLLLVINLLLLTRTQSPHNFNKSGDRLSLATGQLLRYLSTHLGVRYKVLGNYGRHFSFIIILTNTGINIIRAKTWSLYFYQSVRILHVPPGGKLVAGGRIRIHHVTGDLYRMDPAENFTQLISGSHIRITLIGQSSIIAKTDVLPNWYVAIPGRRTMVLQATSGESLSFVEPFDKPVMWKKGSEDTYNPLSPRDRYVHNNYSDLGFAPLKVIPQPLILRPSSGHVTIDHTWEIVSDPECLPEAKYLAGKLGLRGAVLTSAEKAQQLVEQQLSASSSCIELSVQQVAVSSANPRILISEERHRLVVTSDPHPAIRISGASRQGVFWALQTLLALAEPEVDAGDAGGGGGKKKNEKMKMKVPLVEIIDSPRFPYRGFMLDVVRNFIPKDEVLLVLEVMAMYKLNKFHLHLTDDNAWRLEIRDLPELTTIGARSGHTQTESDRLLPQLGVGPALTSGFYSAADYRAILRHARRHHIEVIPELDFPGHARAAIKAMQRRSENATRRGDDTSGGAFLLSDPEDASVYVSMQQFSDNVVNPCLVSTYNFLTRVLSELVRLHADIMPLTSLHIGGDEIPQGALRRSPACGARSGVDADVPKAIRNFQKHFIGLAARTGLGVQAWDDAFFSPDGTPVAVSALTGRGDPPITLHTRHSRWDGGRAHRPIQLANSGYQVVHAAATYLFLDHAQEPDPTERGQHWATRYVDTRRVFSFAPLTYYSDVDVDRHGNDMSLDDVCGQNRKPCPILDKPWNIIGISGHLWTEMVRTVPQMHQMTFPRLLAVAERSWHNAPWELLADLARRRDERHRDWTRFSNTLGYRELRRLEELGVQFYLPPPGAVTENGVVKMNSHIPGLPIEYSKDGGATWREGKETVAVPGLLIRTKSYGSGRTSRTIGL